ncbi:MAG: ribosome-associated translation inhibitor RaiA [Actinomycetota bacterium]|jgi:putative sigma-54 modulation protein|nr:ribosome-associated translation inhibitor RaiA [Actinomycetota bacterium]
MEFKIRSKNIDLDDKIKEYAQKKIRDRVDKFLDKVVEAELKLIFEKNPRINENTRAEVTVFTAGAVIRAEDTGTDVFSAIDKVSDKLERQAKRFKNKRIQRGRKSPASAGENNVAEKIKKQIVKTKSFTLKPIPPEEAVMQMELLGHDFFVFINSDTNSTAVVYRRKDSNYGLIEPTTE